MIRPVRVAAGIVVLAAIVTSIESIIADQLHSRLPDLLERSLGLPVTLAPLRLDLIALSARSGELRIGEDNVLAVQAEAVLVDLNWTALLQGTIQFDQVEAGSLRLTPSNWPTTAESSATAEPGDFVSVMPWLPRAAALDALRVDTSSDTYLSFASVTAKRETGDLLLSWTSGSGTQQTAGELALTALEQALSLRALNARLRLRHQNPDLSPSDIAITVTPSQEAAYQLQLHGALAGMRITLNAAGEHAWQVPARSTTQVGVLLPAQVTALTQSLLAIKRQETGATSGREDPQLTVLALPPHTAELQAADIKLRGRQAFHDLALALQSDGGGAVSATVSMAGPYANVTADARLDSASGPWSLVVDAALTSHTTDVGILDRYNDTPLVATAGNIHLEGLGATVSELLNGLDGEFALEGNYRAHTDVPLSIRGRFDSSIDALALTELHLRAGDSTLLGALTYTPIGANRPIALHLRAERLNLDFLDIPTSSPDQSTSGGIELPLHWRYPMRDVELSARIGELRIAGVSASNIDLSATHGLDGGHHTLTLQGPQGGSALLQSNYSRSASGETQLQTELRTEQLNVPALLGLQPGALDTRANLLLAARSAGSDWRASIDSLGGTLQIDLEARRDRDWARNSSADEQFSLTSRWQAVREDTQLAGVKLSELHLDSQHHQLRGSASLSAVRTPLLIADISAARLDIDRIQEWFSVQPSAAAAIPTKPSPSAAEDDILDTLRELPSVDLALSIDQLRVQGVPLTSLAMNIRSRPDQLSLDTVEFLLGSGRIDAAASLDWDQRNASMRLEAPITGLKLRELLPAETPLPESSLEHPLSGNLVLDASGETAEDLFKSLSGSLFLDDEHPDAGEERLDVRFERLVDGSRIRVNQLNLAGSALSGEIRRKTADIDRYDVTLEGSSLDLRPWQAALAELETAAAVADTNTGPMPLKQTAQLARGLLGFAGALVPGQAAENSSDKLFAGTPVDIAPLRNNDLHIRAKLAKVSTDSVDARDLLFQSELGDGVLSIDGRAASVNGGPGRLVASFDATASPYKMVFSLDARGVHRDPAMAFFPLSADMRLYSEGNTDAALASNMQGAAYVELGKGKVNLDAMSLISADVATTALRTLIPGTKVSDTSLSCGVTVLQVDQGHLHTPYGYILRTDSANLLGELDVDLPGETINLHFQSRSREGVGISIGNAFSGAVEIAGPLSDPQIVPNTPGLLLRGWAAFATAGLSVIGESMYNRLLASSNPCNSIRREIRENVCGQDKHLGQSTLACRDAADAAESAPLNAI